MLRPIINTHKNINLTDSGAIWRTVWGIMEKDGIYIVAGVMVGGGKWYLHCFRCDVLFFFFFSGGVWWIMCMGRSVRDSVCSHAYILEGFQIFYLVGCFVMGRLWWLFFVEAKDTFFFMFCCRHMLALVSLRWL